MNGRWVEVAGGEWDGGGRGKRATFLISDFGYRDCLKNESACIMFAIQTRLCYWGKGYPSFIDDPAGNRFREMPKTSWSGEHVQRGGVHYIWPRMFFWFPLVSHRVRDKVTSDTSYYSGVFVCRVVWRPRWYLVWVAKTQYSPKELWGLARQIFIFCLTSF